MTIKITNDEIALLPLDSFNGPITLVNREEQLPEVLAEIFKEKVLGFDVESPPVFEKHVYYPPALLQLATAEKAWIIQLKRLPVLSSVFQILAERDIIKAGVAISRDLTDLQHLAPFKPAAFVELSDLSTQKGIENNGLRGLAAACLHFRISKSAQRSNWGAHELSAAQLRYAATDAWCCYLIYQHLLELENV